MRSPRFAPTQIALVFACAVAALASVAVRAADPPPVAATLAAGTKVRFHVASPIGSNLTKTGSTFAFALLDPIVIDGATVAEAGALGSGTVILAGHAGTAGHEGDLTLRIDTVDAVDGRQIAFDDQRLFINGRNRKMMSALAGFVPFAGMGARFIRGSDIHIDPADPVETVLVRAAKIEAKPPQLTIMSSATPAASTELSASPSPVPTPTVIPSQSAAPVGPQPE